MVELDENGQIPRKDICCRIYHIKGYKDGKLWEGQNIWSGGPYPTMEHIEGYDTFCGWASTVISGKERSSQPSEEVEQLQHERARIALVVYNNRQHLELWLSRQNGSQKAFSERENFVAWVTDTLSFLPATRTPEPPDLSQDLEALARNGGPITDYYRKKLREAAQLIRENCK